MKTPSSPDGREARDVEFLLSLIERAKTLCFVGQAKDAYDVLKGASEIAERYTPALDLTEGEGEG